MANRPPERKPVERSGRKDRFERFMRHIEPELRQAQRVAGVRRLARHNFLPSLVYWTAEYIRKDIEHWIAAGRLDPRVAREPVRAAALFREKRAVAKEIVEAVEGAYERMAFIEPDKKAAFLKELQLCLLETTPELRHGKTVTEAELMAEREAWEERGVRIDPGIERAFLEESARAVRQTRLTTFRAIMGFINRELAELQNK